MLEMISRFFFIQRGYNHAPVKGVTAMLIKQLQ